MTKDNLLSNLNPEQLEAVTTIEQPLKLIAGAGSGKTRVITTKIAHLIKNHGYFPWRILAVTFTNKAAGEMKSRVEDLVENLVGNPWILTFHALGVRILRQNYASIGLSQKFNIIDSSDQKTIIKRIVKQMMPGEETSHSEWEKSALHQISHWKNQLVDPQEAKKESQNPRWDKLAKIYESYEKELNRNQALDFDDLLIKAVEILKKDKTALANWQRRFDYVLVDEFQDTNQVQFDLIKLLMGDSLHLTVVGDVDQTIYSWRGAKISLINNFHREFPKVKTVVLNQNYRSTQEILNLANDFIALNPHQEVKRLKSNQKSGAKPQIQETLTAYYEAEFIVQEIKRLKKQFNYENKDFFILYRSNYWSRNLEEALSRKKLPFDLIGGIKFRERRVIKDAMAFMKVLLTNDDLSLQRVLQVTPRIGAITISKMQAMAQKRNISLFSLLIAEDEAVLGISKYLKPLRETFILAQKMEGSEPLAKLTKFLLTESGYWEYIKNTDNEDQENLDNLKELIQQLNNFDKDFDNENYGTENRLLAFLQEEALASNEDQSQSPNKITLLTIHSAKGLENKVVFVAGLNQNVFPNARSLTTPKQLEEERRLLYVAITRAQEHLYLSYINGEYSFVTKSEMRPSIFIGELNKDYFQWHHSAFATNHNEIEHHLPLSAKIKPLDHKVAYKRGDLVNHFALGDGVVTKVIDNEVFVAFNNPKHKVQAIAINSPVLRKK